IGLSVSNVQINLSTTQKPVDGLSAAFAQNVGNNDTKVFGPSQIAWFNEPTVAYSATFTFTTPFFYDPSAGNLLVDLRVFGSGRGLGPMDQADMAASLSGSDGVSRVYAFNVNSASGTADTVGL